MCPHEVREEIDRAFIAVLVRTRLQITAKALDDGLVVSERRRDHAARIVSPPCVVLQSRGLQVLFEGSGGNAVERAGTLGNIVDHLAQPLVMLLEELIVTIFVSTHFMSEVSRCDRISLMHAGRVLLSDTPLP